MLGILLKMKGVGWGEESNQEDPILSLLQDMSRRMAALESKAGVATVSGEQTDLGCPAVVMAVTSGSTQQTVPPLQAAPSVQALPSGQGKQALLGSSMATSNRPTDRCLDNGCLVPRVG